jgi:hypothetical protein
MIAAAALAVITLNLCFAKDNDTAGKSKESDSAIKQINGFPVSRFCFYGGLAYSLESRLCGGVAQLLICKQNDASGYAQWDVGRVTPEPCPITPPFPK